MRNRYKKMLLTLLGLAMLNGCAGTPTHTEEGALIGGGTGAAIGAIADPKRPLQGALIGGGIGTVAGAVVGNSADQKAQREAARNARGRARHRAPTLRRR